MTFLAFKAANVFDCHAVHFAGLYIVMEFFIDTIKLISMALIIIKLNFCFPMTINTPAHTQVCKLFYFRHFLDVSMTGLALLFADLHVL